MMLIGVILVIAAIALFMLGYIIIGEEEDYLKKAVRYDGMAAGFTGHGGSVLIEGKISGRNSTIIHDFVHAAKENNDAGTWRTMERHFQPVIANLAGGEVTLVSEFVCDRGKGKKVLETEERTPNSDPVRFTGLKIGAPITAVGTLTGLSPASLTVKYWYSGSADDYMSAVKSNRNNIYIFCPIIALAGAVFFLFGWKKRNIPNPPWERFPGDY